MIAPIAQRDIAPFLPFRSGGTWGYLNRDGSVACPPRFRRADRFAEGLARTKLNGHLVVLDESFEVQFELPGVESYSQFSSGLLAVEFPDETRGYVRHDGSVAIAGKFSIARDFSGDRAIAGMAGASPAEHRYGVIDLTGTWVVHPEYDWINPFLPDEPFTTAKHEGGYRLLDRDGKIAFDRPYRHMGGFASDRLPYLIDRPDASGLYGLLDGRGEVVLAPTYEQANAHFQNGYLGVERCDGGWNLLDLEGRPVVESDYLYLSEPRNGILCAYRGGKRDYDRNLGGGKFGFVDLSGREVVPFRYEVADWYDDEMISVEWPDYVPEEGEEYDITKWTGKAKLGYVNLQGVEIWREE